MDKNFIAKVVVHLYFALLDCITAVWIFRILQIFGVI